MDARRKRLRYGAGRAAGPPTPPGYGISTHHPTPKLLMKAKFLAEIYLSHIREHEKLSNKNGAHERTRPQAANTVGLH